MKATLREIEAPFILFEPTTTPAASWKGTEMPSTILKVAAPAALFLLAVVVGYLGLGVGLQVSPVGAYVLWGVAVALLLLNGLWIVRRVVGLRAGAV